MKNKLTLFRMKSLTRLFVLLLCFAATPSHAIETITYYHTDSLGSPVAGTDTSGALLWKEDYQPYGQRIRKQVESDKNTRWYTGHPEDKETGLTYAGARFYDPVVGRFLAIDPVGFRENNLQSFSRYAYAINNPYKYIDPDGKDIFNPNSKSVNSNTMKRLIRLDKSTPGVNYTITSGERSTEQNKEVGGSSKSKHLSSEGGSAVDVNPSISSTAKASGATTKSIAKQAHKEGFTGIITYTNKNGTSKNKNGGRLHLDTRKKKFHSDTYKKGGKTRYRATDFSK